jgi:hypothetical protein
MNARRRKSLDLKREHARGRHTQIVAGAGDDEETPPGMQRITLSFTESDEGPQYN